MVFINQSLVSQARPRVRRSARKSSISAANPKTAANTGSVRQN
jgi:hypothetical protein